MKDTEDIITELDEIQDEIEHIDNQLASVQIEDRGEEEYFQDQLMRLQKLDEKIENLKEDILGGRDGRKHEKET